MLYINLNEVDNSFREFTLNSWKKKVETKQCNINCVTTKCHKIRRKVDASHERYTHLQFLFLWFHSSTEVLSYFFHSIIFIRLLKNARKTPTMKKIFTVELKPLHFFHIFHMRSGNAFFTVNVIFQKNEH